MVKVYIDDKEYKRDPEPGPPMWLGVLVAWGILVWLAACIGALVFWPW